MLHKTTYTNRIPKVLIVSVEVTPNLFVKLRLTCGCSGMIAQTTNVPPAVNEYFECNRHPSLPQTIEVWQE